MVRDLAALGSCRRGAAFALLKTIIALAMVAGLLQALCVRSLDAAAEAERAEQACQRRWAATTSRLVLLSNAPLVLNPFGDSLPPSFPSRTVVFPLGDVVIEARLMDEQAKANVSQLLEEVGEERVRELLREAGAADGLADLVVLPELISSQASTESGRAASTTPDPRRVFGAWTELVPTVGSRALLETVGRGGVLDRFTLWGSGQLNFQAATPEVVRAFAGHAIDDAALAKAIAARDEGSRRHPYKVLRSVGVPSGDADLVDNSLTNQSRCYSLLLRMHQGAWSGGELTVRRLDVAEADGWRRDQPVWTRTATWRFPWE